MVLAYDIQPEMFINAHEFKVYLRYIQSQLEPHFRIYDDNTSSTNMNSTFIKTPQGVGYFFAQITKGSVRFLEFYDEILKEVDTETIVFSLYGCMDYSIMLFYLSAFLPKNYDKIIHGYHVKTTSSKISIESKFSQYKNGHNRNNIGDYHEKKKLVFLCNEYSAVFLATLFPDAEVYSPNSNLRVSVPIGFEGNTYYLHDEINENIPENIIYDIPPKKYWPC